MKYYWKNGFYIEGISVIPEGAVEISEELYNSLIEGQANGKRIVTNETTGMPELEDYPPLPVTSKDYKDAMEKHLYNERAARGYTIREPSPTYDNSTNERWRQDAADWKTHFTQVMEYGLSVMNDYDAGKPVPTLEEFKDLLPQIHWTAALTE